MLQFFRRYQKYFFAVITVVIVMTFVFFGTYQAVAPNFRNQGEEKSHVDYMADFLNTEQWMVSRKFFAANFLNDGVISKEFLETGLGDLIVAAEAEGDSLRGACAARFEKEKGYSPYKHPFNPSLSAEALWSLFAPELPEKLKAHQQNNGAFKERKELFLAQKKFPPALLSQVLRYHEQNNPQVPMDSRLAREDVALFGYQTISDWFGEDFIKAVANNIIKIAQVAKKQGYRVSQEELHADLMARSQEIYKSLKDKIELPVSDGYGLFQLYLQHMGLTEANVLKIWEDVTLFRRLMHGVGDAALIDPLPLSQFYAYAYENAIVELYQMPPEFRFKSLDELKLFEVYLAAAGEKVGGLNLPSQYAPLEIIEGRAPELLGKRYRISVASITKKGLQSKVSAKETLQWECQQEHWLALQKQFPSLAQKRGEPFDILEGMDKKQRKLIDDYVRSQIVETHPEWIVEALNEAKLEEKQLFLSPAVRPPFEGMNDLTALMTALDTQDELTSLTQDGLHFYRLVVEQRAEGREVLSFKTAKKEGILEKLAQSIDVEERLVAIKHATPEAYKERCYSYRFAPFLVDKPTGPLSKQFLSEKKEKTITRSEESFVKLDEILALEKGAFSEIKIDSKEGAYLYRFLERTVDTTLPLEKMQHSQELLSQEARCRYFEKFLTIPN